jgi:hypothetical protein
LLPAVKVAVAQHTARPVLRLAQTGDTVLPWPRALLLGLLCGFALISEYPIAVALVGLGVLALTRLSWRGVGFAALGGLLPIVLMMVYNTRAFGTIWPVGYAHSALWQDQHHTGFMSITYPRPEAIFGLTLGSYRGLFFRSPWLLAAIPGFVLWYQSRELRGAWWVTLGVAVSVMLFYSSSVMWWGGFGVGPRYVVPAIPFLALAAAWGLRPLWQWAAGRAAAIALVLLAVALVWSEALARQGFPPDTVFNSWIEYTLPAWQAGDLARSLGTALGLRGPLAILPLVAGVGVLLAFLLLDRGRAGAHQAYEAANAADATAVSLGQPSVTRVTSEQG